MMFHQFNVDYRKNCLLDDHVFSRLRLTDLVVSEMVTAAGFPLRGAPYQQYATLTGQLGDSKARKKYAGKKKEEKKKKGRAKNQ